MDMVLHWTRGFWELLTFSIADGPQVITASTVAKRSGDQKAFPPRVPPKNSKQAVYFVALSP